MSGPPNYSTIIENRILYPSTTSNAIHADALMKQSRKRKSKERRADILMHGWATSKDPDMLLFARGLPETKWKTSGYRDDAIEAVSKIQFGLPLLSD